MKVLQINSVCGTGSTGRICTDLADVLVEQGHECKVAYGRGQPPERYKKYAVRIGNDLDVKLHGLKARVFDRAGWGSRAATVEFLKWVKAYNPDIVHLHNIHGYYLNIELLFQYLRQAGKPIVWTLHDCWTFTGHCSHFDYIGCERWKTGCHHCPQKNTYPASYVLDQSKRNWLEKRELYQGLNMTIVSPSRWLAGLVKQSFLGGYPVQMIHNGIDLNVFKPSDNGEFRKAHGLKDKFIVLGVASEWTERKGLKDFIKLSGMLAQDDRYRIVLVGLSAKQLQGLPKNIIGISRTDNVQQLAEIYSTANVFVNPTYEDNYPTVNLEAIACGTPVITYDTGGSPETVSRNHGFVIEKGNVNELFKLAQSISESKKKCNAGEDKTGSFSSVDRFAEYVSLYKEIVDEPR